MQNPCLHSWPQMSRIRHVQHGDVSNLPFSMMEVETDPLSDHQHTHTHTLKNTSRMPFNINNTQRNIGTSRHRSQAGNTYDWHNLCSKIVQQRHQTMAHQHERYCLPNIHYIPCHAVIVTWWHDVSWFCGQSPSGSMIFFTCNGETHIVEKSTN